MGIVKNGKLILGLLPVAVILALAAILLLVVGIRLLPGVLTGGQAQDGVIAFASNRTGNFEVYVMDENGSDQVRLTRTSQPPTDSPAGQIRTRFAGALNVALQVPANNRYPAWSPSGDQLAYFSTQNGSAVLVMDVAGQSSNRLAHAAQEGSGPAWSPDGSRVVYVDEGLQAIGVDGRGRRLLTDSTIRDYDPDWSPDGSQVVFRSMDRFEGRGDSFNQIYVLDVLTGDVVQLTDSRAQNLEPVWSPDGRHIAFVSLRDGNAEIYVMAADGSNQTRLTTHPAWDQSPTWSPDGLQIAFVSRRDVDYDIYVMGADGSGLRQLTNNDADDVDPDWRPR